MHHCGRKRDLHGIQEVVVMFGWVTAALPLLDMVVLFCLVQVASSLAGVLLVAIPVQTTSMGRIDAKALEHAVSTAARRLAPVLLGRDFLALRRFASVRNIAGSRREQILKRDARRRTKTHEHIALGAQRRREA